MTSVIPQTPDLRYFTEEPYYGICQNIGNVLKRYRSTGDEKKTTKGTGSVSNFLLFYPERDYEKIEWLDRWTKLNHDRTAEQIPRDGDRLLFNPVFHFQAKTLATTSALRLEHNFS